MNHWRIIYLFVLLFSFVSCKSSYFRKDFINKNKINLSKGDTIFTLHFYHHEKKIPLKVSREYYWFDKNQIHSSQGAYIGKLLHGSYHATNRKNELLTMGSFKYGLKEGLWLHYHPNGKIKKQVNWGKGKLSGQFCEYYENGNIKQQATYQNDKPHGKIIQYTLGGEVEALNRYKKGILIVKKERSNRSTDKVDTISNKSRFLFFNRKRGSSEKAIEDKPKKEKKVKLKENLPGGGENELKNKRKRKDKSIEKIGNSANPPKKEEPKSNKKVKRKSKEGK